ncbi:PLP-dependent aminotransferase family protein [Streptomyces sp. NPDC006739]|uniref:aminotransferase-like domain-containing protein n=1 Tax=Streptomyces sp. NPDC006739 TaxID=3364763 RepID=UPI0036C52DA3
MVHVQAGRSLMVRLPKAELHGVLDDPALESIEFLNEIMTRYPDAISFAPGAPHPRFVKDLDVSDCIDVYTRHVSVLRGTTQAHEHRRLLEYGPSRGLINDLIADALSKDHGLDLSPDSVVVTVGAQEAMLLTLRVLCRPGRDLLAVADPCFTGVTGAARLLDIGIVPIAETEHGLDHDALAAACRAARQRGRTVRAVYAAPDHSNPSGSVMTLRARHQLLSVAEREKLLVIEDNAYGFTAAPGHELPLLKALDTDGRVILVGTFAKVCTPGARVGFAVADQVVADADGSHRVLAGHLAAAKNAVTVNTSPISQAIIGGMLLRNNGSIKQLGQEKSAHYRERLAVLLAALDRSLPSGTRPEGVRWNRPRGGFFVRLRLPVPVDVALLEQCAQQFGVLWTPMSYFHLGDGGGNELRLSCSYLSSQEIREGARRLAAFVHHATASTGEQP